MAQQNPSKRHGEIIGTDDNFPSCCRVYRTAALNHTSNGAWEAVTFDTVDFDTDGSFSSPSTQLVCRVAGVYVVQGNLGFAASATGQRGIQLQQNSTAIAQVSDASPGAGDITVFNLTATAKLAQGDAMSLYGWQNTGGNFAYSVSSPRLNLSMVRIASF